MMNIIYTNGYVVGIFADWTRARAFISDRPVQIANLTQVNAALSYPFYLFQSGVDGWIDAFARRDEVPELPGILFVIEGDWWSDDWSDRMGSLPHHHQCDPED
jgi:hypothetical protein